MTTHIKGVPGTNSAAYIAGRAIYARGPVNHEQLFSLARFGVTAGAQSSNLKKAVDNGWLVDDEGVVRLSDRAQHYYAGTEPEPKPMGSLATPRENVNAGLPMTARHRPDTRGRRQDAMDNSLAAMPSHYARVAS